MLKLLRSLFSEKSLPALLLFVASLVFCLDLFIHQGRPQTFDGPTHISNIAQFGLGLKAHQFPVYWADSFAIFGLPIPMLAQQITSYVGALFWLITGNLVLSYNLVVVVAIFVSALLYYAFLRYFFSPWISLVASFFFMFAPYRILNVYIRGALPEFFASIFVPLLLIGLWEVSKNKLSKGAVLVLVAIAGLILTHPMMLILAAMLVGPFALYLLLTTKRPWQQLLVLGITSVLAVGITAYYFMPLLLEIKYFYYGLKPDHLNTSQFVSLENYLRPAWFYSSESGPGPRVQYPMLGSLESVLLLGGLILGVWGVVKKKAYSWLLLGSSILGLVLIFLTLPFSEGLYKTLPLLHNIQFPWRTLASLIFIPPFILAWLMVRLPQRAQTLLAIGVVLFVIVWRFPQLYGKNYYDLPETNYIYPHFNLHTSVLNTIWSGQISDYPPKTKQIDVIEGQAQITNQSIKNGHRVYEITAETPVRLVDNTFYFPGWRITNNNQEVPIEFQDPNYRGLITYQLPAGQHTVTLHFGDTKVRLLGKLITVASLVLSVLGFFVLKHYTKWDTKRKYASAA